MDNEYPIFPGEIFDIIISLYDNITKLKLRIICKNFKNHIDNSICSIFDMLYLEESCINYNYLYLNSFINYIKPLVDKNEDIIYKFDIIYIIKLLLDNDIGYNYKLAGYMIKTFINIFNLEKYDRYDINYNFGATVNRRIDFISKILSKDDVKLYDLIIKSGLSIGNRYNKFIINNDLINIFKHRFQNNHKLIFESIIDNVSKWHTASFYLFSYDITNYIIDQLIQNNYKSLINKLKNIPDYSFNRYKDISVKIYNMIQSRLNHKNILKKS